MFFTKQRGRLKTKIFLENLRSLEKAIGYGVNPLIEPLPEEKERQGSDEQKPLEPVLRPESVD